MLIISILDGNKGYKGIGIKEVINKPKKRTNDNEKFAA